MTLDLASALAMVAAAEERARQHGLAVSVAVVDGGGNLIALHRMDGACIATIDLARDKAYSALALKEATHEVLPRCQPGQPAFGLHHAGGGRLVLLSGGLPVLLGAEVVGGVGVSGAPDEDDIACARAALATLGAA